MNKTKTLRFIVVFLLIIIFIMWFFILNNRKTPASYFWNNFIEYSSKNVNFAWEIMPTEWKYFTNIQKYDKQFLLSAYTTYQIILYKKRSAMYFPFIEKELEKRWMPDDIKYLAVAESALINKNDSYVWASWIWQFMPETAKRFWLIVDENVDERYNFEKSTIAALDYLEFLYWKFWNRTLAMSAYNRGEGWISRAMENQWVYNFYDLELNEETANYPFRVLAIKYTMKGLDNIKLESQFWDDFHLPNIKEYYVYEIPDLDAWVKERWVSIKEVRELNEWIIWDFLEYNEKGWIIRIAK